jgi:beta-carotene hydroxylase
LCYHIFNTGEKLGLGQATVWLSLWPLVIYELIPLWAGFFVASLCACFTYLPSHEAQHGNYSRGNPKRKWFDKLVGHITLIIPYEILRVTHMKSHAYTNDSENDIAFEIKERKSLLEVIRKSFSSECFT